MGREMNSSATLDWTEPFVMILPVPPLVRPPRPGNLRIYYSFLVFPWGVAISFVISWRWSHRSRMSNAQSIKLVMWFFYQFYPVSATPVVVF
ncbi:hypothetical protein SODALDRAFT_328570 [Sodiomyces alkalinus F11]|uniref:Uncharacterized protein n=1 Tax=Sodiomyces alkalinus (strain CBS 110278 / VKM F-3762 / F11) TaxID=1314773 RepID=A0A3N2PL47_SODAK|nr:hypothetical protein SODALDRAFT_328570 [Sodiomyces alkalinus F11]ROT35253.1 hypothetical protein SODALDRAFT_328570 [Sodiomyces alkalinus F11]